MDRYLVYDFKNADVDLLMNILGDNDSNLNLLAESFGCHLQFEDSMLYTDDGKTLLDVKNCIKQLIEIYNEHNEITKSDVQSVLNGQDVSVFMKKEIIQGTGNRKYYLRSKGQKELYDAFESCDMTFAIGPAGTGKTFLACVYASNLLKKGLIRKIIITRPVVEAGESLGFLPGDLKEKVDPYLIPIYDCLEMIYGYENVMKLIERGIVEIAPLAYMRGRTLNDACVILDEAQNTTAMQMKMFLTRLGFKSKMIITGDITQIDLPSSKKSGLVDILSVLKDVEGIKIVWLSEKDVVRHPLVQKIIEAYK
ncbi:MAG: PhoH family protein [Erysipelotrichaceae bacterium]|nr:PhoH family protein [Erysipelotrichaceae bacterium]